MQSSHCHWEHSFLLPKCELGKLLVADVPFAVESVILPVAVAVARYKYQLYSSAQKVS